MIIGNVVLESGVPSQGSYVALVIITGKRGAFMLFGTLNPFLEREYGFSYDSVGGDYVFFIEFYNALINYGSFDEYHFFVEEDNFTRSVESKKYLMQMNDNVRRVKIRQLSDLPHSLAHNNYTCFHDTNCLDGFMKLLYLRDEFSDIAFPITATIHGTIFQSFFYSYFLYLISSIYPCDSIVCVSDSARYSLEKILSAMIEKAGDVFNCNLGYSGRVDTIPIGIDTQLFTPREKHPIRKELNLPANKIIVLSVSRLTNSTKMDLYPVIQSAKKELFDTEEGKDVVLLIAGKNVQGYSDDCRRLVHQLDLDERIRFFVDIPRASIPALYAASDIFISPIDTVGEAFGLTVLEALSSGLPVVVSDFDGYAEIVTSERVGYKIPTYWARIGRRIDSLSPLRELDSNQFLLSQSFCVDVPKMYEYVRILIGNAMLRRKMSEAAREHAVHNYDWSVIITRYESLWRKLSDLSHGNTDTAGEKINSMFFRPDYFENVISPFSPVTTLGDDTEISPTRFGEDFLDDKMNLTLHKRTKSVISEGLVKRLLKLSMKCKNMHEMFDELDSTGRDASEIERAQYHIMWMIKYGLLAVKT